jgi:hypothetical protein
VIEIRSYRRVFDLERRIYSIDRYRLNPTGIPVRGVLYFLAAVALSLALSAMPLVGALARAVPWFLRDLVLPASSAALLSLIRVDGRTCHLAALGLLGMVMAPRRISALTGGSGVGARWCPPELTMLPDGAEGRLRRLSYRGPGAVLVQVRHTRMGVSERGRVGFGRGRSTVRIADAPDGGRVSRGQVIVLEPGGRLLVTPAART